MVSEPLKLVKMKGRFPLTKSRLCEHEFPGKLSKAPKLILSIVSLIRSSFFV